MLVVGGLRLRESGTWNHIHGGEKCHCQGHAQSSRKQSVCCKSSLHSAPLMAGPHREQLTLQNWDLWAQPQGRLTEQRRTVWSWDITA